MIGERFGKWVVLEKGVSVGKHTRWICKCNCGTIKTCYQNNLRRGKTTNCGCVRTKTGHSEKPTHSSWQAMIERCLPTWRSHHNYYDRGITVCEEWKDFVVFFNDLGERPKGTVLDRIDNEKGYYKENCRWVDYKESTRNRRCTIWLTYENETLSLKQWSDRLNISYETLLYRKLHGYSDKKIIEFKRTKGSKATWLNQRRWEDEKPIGFKASKEAKYETYTDINGIERTWEKK